MHRPAPLIYLPAVQIANGTRQSASLSYLDPILTRPNLDIVVNTHVVKLVQTGTCAGKPEFLGVQLSQPGSCTSFRVQ
jgi:choline dehydrogenase-like flavoprotein